MFINAEKAIEMRKYQNMFSYPEYSMDGHYTDISLLLGKYTRMFVPRFPGIPEILQST